MNGSAEMREKVFYYLKRYAVLCVGLLIMAFGVAFSIKAGLGTSPISSLPYVVSILVEPLSVGTATIIMHCVFILLQIILLRRKYQWIQLIQLPVAIVFGYLTDFGVWAIDSIPVPNYFVQWVLCIVGVILVGIGVSFEVTANVVTLAGEGLILAICKVTPVKFPTMKVIFDVALVIIAVVVSLIFLRRVEGVREGTLAAAIFTGLTAKVVNIPMKKFADKFLALPETS